MPNEEICFADDLVGILTSLLCSFRRALKFSSAISASSWTRLSLSCKKSMQSLCASHNRWIRSGKEDQIEQGSAIQARSTLAV